MQASGLDSLMFSSGLGKNKSEGNVDGLSSSDDWATFVLTSKAIQEVESTARAGQ
jgi:hypothetical protein